ncbi:MAG: hypothetical protein GF317_24700 [Candidatus Lokiarchaeota archaeon]|nr:hypothetical protein [Candidatus Lokiarchaeota archaeon]MBD3202561.1 hypothetical protein [Candidatus Lokiarchaeota archaeon]
MTLIETIFREASRLDIDAVLIGGLALPAYSVIRTTLDIDIAISIESQDKLDEFIERMKRNEVKTKS